MIEKIDRLHDDLINRINSAKSEAELTAADKFAKLELAKSIATIKDFPPENRAEAGKKFNQLKNQIQKTIDHQRLQLSTQQNETKLDFTAPSQTPVTGSLHLVTQAIDEITEIFERLGFNRVRYPEVETDWYAFESLNMHADHPARDEWETFFVENPENLKLKKPYVTVLTPHTSSGQVREMHRAKTPPIRMLNIAKCYRRQSDVSHNPFFYQFEGLLIDQNISISHLKGTLDFFVKNFFGPERETRLRPYHFQFTEPSFEIDITCGVCKGKGCKVCKEGWLELGGAGMVHPNVLAAGNIDHKKYSGFAFGWGVERTMMMKDNLNIDDVRKLYEPDLRFLRQF